jgi:hypothetical protein
MHRLVVVAALALLACKQAPSSAPPPSAPPPPPAEPGAVTYDLRPARTLTWQEAQGAGGSRDGDFVTWEHFSGITCGSLYKAQPREALFILCGDRLIAGPLTTEAEVREVYELMQQELAEAVRMKADMMTFAFELGRSVRSRMPDGCSNCVYRVYDRNGNYLRTE